MDSCPNTIRRNYRKKKSSDNLNNMNHKTDKKETVKMIRAWNEILTQWLMCP